MDILEIQKILPKFKQHNFAKIFTVADMENSYMEYVKSIGGRKISLGIPTLDSALGLIRPSQVVTVIAGTNVGKTALALNIIRANADTLKDKIIILFELEIDQNEIYERMLQMELDLSTKDVEDAFINLNDNYRRASELKYRLPNIISVINRIDVEDILPFCLACKELAQKEIGFIAVDYLGLVQDSYTKDEYSRVTSVMQKLKEIALSINVPVLNLSQPSRQDLKNNTGLTLYSGKSSGEIENSSQIVITLERVDNTNSKQRHKSLVLDAATKQAIERGEQFLLKAKIEKKKQGKYGECYLLFNTKSTVIREMGRE